MINAIVLGTWSFSATDQSAIPLLDRIIGTFDIIHRAGLWEMMGQLTIVSALAHIAIILTYGKTTIMHKFKDIKLFKSEKIACLIGLILMLMGAIIESIAINL